MRVNEFIEEITKVAKNKDMLNKKLESLLNVKQYIPVAKKKEIVIDIVDNTIYFNDGIYKFNEFDKCVYYIMKCINEYTDLEVSDDYMADYDILCESGLVSIIIEMFKKEYEEIGVMLNMECDSILMDNSVEVQLAKFFEKVNSKLDNINEIVQNANEMTLPIKKEDVDTIVNFLNMYAKDNNKKDDV